MKSSCFVAKSLMVSMVNPFLDVAAYTLQWRHNERDGVSNHQRLDGLLKRLFRRRSKKTSKLRVTGPCEGILTPVTGEFPSQRTSMRKMFPFVGIIMKQVLLGKDKNISLQWYHVNIMTSEINSNSTDCSTNWSLVDNLHEGPGMEK